MKLRVFPMLGQFLASPLIIFVTGPARSSGPGFQPYIVGFSGAFIAMLPAMMMDRLRMGDDWSAAELFRYAPVPRIAAVFHRVRKAVILALCVPGLTLVTGLALVFLRDPKELLLLAPGLVALPVFSLLPGLGRVFLPFAEPPEAQVKDALGCIFLALFMLGALALGGLTGWAWGGGWFGRMLAGEAALAFTLAILLCRVLAGRVLRAEQ